MKSLEKNIDRNSDYFINTPSADARSVFLYPTHLGHFRYLPGYSQRRAHFDSFLLMYVLEGSLSLEFQNRTITVNRDTFVLIDCYQPHAYSSAVGWEALWIHFDGITARKLYEMAVSGLGNTFSIDQSLPVLNKMAKIYQMFAAKQPVRDAMLSKWLNDILTSLILYTPAQVQAVQKESVIEDVKGYIQEHIREEVSIDELARVAMMSPYHFIRVFKNETGMTPHAYVLSYRIHVGMYLLESTSLSVSDICYETGFSSASVFSAAFRRQTGQTPTAYRRDHTQ